MTKLDGRDITLRSLPGHGGVVHASLPGLAAGTAAAGDPIAGQLASDGAAVDVTGYYLLGLWPSRWPVLADWRTWPWPPGLDPFFLMAHSTPEGQMCLMVDGLMHPVTDQALGSWLGTRPELSTSERALEDPVVLLTCGLGARQQLADLLGRLSWVAHGETTVGVKPLDGVGRTAGSKVRLGVRGTTDGLGGQFRSAYPQGPAGDRVRWAYRSRFTSSPAHWLVERSASATRAPAGLRPYMFGGKRALGLCYFDLRDRASRASVLNAAVLGSTHVEWTPNDAYRPAATAHTDPVAGLLRAVSRPWHSRDLGELPFSLDGVAIVACYFDGGLFAVYDEEQDVSYWETPEAFGLRLRKDLAAAQAGGPAWGPSPRSVLLLTDCDAVPGSARREVARGLGGPELITVNMPSALSPDKDQEPGVSRARIALLPGTHGTTVVPKWTRTTSQGSSVTLSPAPDVLGAGVQTAEKTLRADLLLTVATGAADRSERPVTPFDEAAWRERSDAVHDFARSSEDLVAAVGDLIQAYVQLGRARGLVDGPGSSLSPQIYAAAELRLAQARDRLTVAETYLDVRSSRLVALGLARPADEHDLDPAGKRDAMREADGLLGRARIVIGTDDKSERIREAQQRVRELVAEQIRSGHRAEALGPDLFTKSGLAGGALEVAGQNLTEVFREQSRTIESEVQDAISKREHSLAAQTADAGKESAELEIAEMKRQAPVEILSRQRSCLVELIDGLKQRLATEQTGAAPGVRPLSQRELDGFKENLSRVEVKLRKMIVEPTGHRGHHELLERSIGRHPDFGAKMFEAKYNNATELARGLSGWVEAKGNRHNEKLLAQQIFADGQVEELIDVLLARIWHRLPDLPNADLIRSELASGVSSFEPGRRLGQYVPYFHSDNLPPHLEHLEAATWREPDHVLAVLREPTRFDLREKVMVLHDLADYFDIPKHTPRTHGSGMLPDTPGVKQSTTEVNAHGYRVASLTDRVRNPIVRSDGTTKDHQQTSNENAAWTILARERRIPVWAGPSYTAVRMFKLTDWFGGSRYEIGAVAYGVFAFWRLHYDHTTKPAYHTLHEVLDLAQNFGLAYTVNSQTATLGTISTSAAAHEARSLATDLRSGTLPVSAGITAAQRSGFHALAARLDTERQAAVHANLISEKLESYTRLLNELEHAKTQLGLTTTLAHSTVTGHDGSDLPQLTAEQEDVRLRSAGRPNPATEQSFEFDTGVTKALPDALLQDQSSDGDRDLLRASVLRQFEDFENGLIDVTQLRNRAYELLNISPASDHLIPQNTSQMIDELIFAYGDALKQWNNTRSNDALDGDSALRAHSERNLRDAEENLKNISLIMPEGDENSRIIGGSPMIVANHPSDYEDGIQKISTQAMIPSSSDLEIVNALSGGSYRETVRDMKREVKRLRSHLGGEKDISVFYEERARQVEQNLAILETMGTRPPQTWTRLKESQIAALVVIQRRAHLYAERERMSAVSRMRRDGWERLYAEVSPEDLVERVHNHLLHAMDLTTNMPVDRIDRLLSDTEGRFRNFWETGTSQASPAQEARADAEELMGYASSLGRSRSSFPPNGLAGREMPKYAALTSRLRPEGLSMYGDVVFTWKKETMNRTTFTPMDSMDWRDAAEGASGITGKENLYPLIAHGHDDVVRLAFAEATEFSFDPELRDIIASGAGTQEYFEAQIHGDLSWSDVQRILIRYPQGWRTAAENDRDRILQHARQYNEELLVNIIEIGVDAVEAEIGGADSAKSNQHTPPSPAIFGVDTDRDRDAPVADDAGTAEFAAQTDSFASVHDQLP
ncbi:hypothetical protein OG819_44705 [Streptomyces sp. NBC_01549]|uniref:hypothetical protein n=1 Tax=Streptomyces sp. NBC_01549 TaxID=2975874 RepID=UPI00224F627E|nr:hypothetical protein [Streptomyces sp. NBC_01549]MCX4596500.1 hypothetical protein [Streptomyces sp. NBC_01549]